VGFEGGRFPPFDLSCPLGFPEGLPWLSPLSSNEEQSRALDELAGLLKVPKGGSGPPPAVPRSPEPTLRKFEAARNRTCGQKTRSYTSRWRDPAISASGGT